MWMLLTGMFSQNNSEQLIIFINAIIDNGHVETLSPLVVTKLI